jgi:PKD repeat protein
MKRSMHHLLPALAVLLALAAGCSKNDTSTGTDPETGPPQIQSLTAEKTQILFGGQDPAVITCNATGGNLTYTWEVDLGDLIPMNSSHSKVSFTGAACCVGDKTIKCTVSNSQGSVSKTIVITILEVITAPEIISLESDKTQLRADGVDSVSFVCYAIGGHLRYDWQTDCGAITLNPSDSSKAVMRCGSACVGLKTVQCTVSNEKGSDKKTLQVNVTK